MSPNEDRISQPSKGRFFALSKGQALHAIKTRSFRHSEHSKRIALELRNPVAQGDMGLPIATFHPSEAIILYSFPEEFAAPRAKALAEAALEEFQRIDAMVEGSWNRRENISYRIYLAENNKLKVTRRVRTATLAKYRGDAKFSNAFKPRKIDTSEELLREISIA